MMFSPCLSPSPSTWPTMAQAALVRVNAKRAANHVPSVQQRSHSKMHNQYKGTHAILVKQCRGMGGNHAAAKT